MKKTLVAAAIALVLAGCQGANQWGECIGISDEDADPALRYDFSVRNAIWSVVGFETGIAPILWVTDYARCPVGRK